MGLRRQALDLLDWALDALAGFPKRNFRRAIDRGLSNALECARAAGLVEDADLVAEHLRKGRGRDAFALATRMETEKPDIHLHLTSAVFNYITHYQTPMAGYGPLHEEGQAPASQAQEAGQGRQEDGSEES